MAKNFDPELIGVLLVMLRPHPSGRFNRGYPPYFRYPIIDEINFYLRKEYRASGLYRAEIKRHLEFMANLGLIKRVQKPASKDGNESELDSLNQWQLCSDEEFGDRFPSPDQGSGNGPGRGDGGNGRDGGSGAGGGNGGGNDGGGDQGDDGQGGGRGIGEVLSHPVLFSLPEAEFVALIDNLFEGPGAP